MESMWAASLDGVPFLVNSDSTKGGRRQAEYQYISTNRRQVQDLGKFLKKFEMSCFISYDPQKQDDYFKKRDALISVLEASGNHVLIHPFYGEVTVATGLYTLTQNSAKLGFAEFNFTATQVSSSINNSLPVPSKIITASTVKAQATKTKESVAKSSSKSFAITKSFKDSYEAAKDTLGNSLNQIKKVIGPIATKINDAAKFVTEVENDVDQVNALLKNPTALFKTVIDRVTGIDSLTDNLIDAMAGMKRFNEFGDAVDQFTSATKPSDQKSLSIHALSPTVLVKFDPITAQEIEIKRNIDLLINAIRQASLLKQYELICKIDFGSVEEINNASAAVEKQYQYIRNSIDDDSIENFANLRSYSRTVLDNKRIKSAYEREIEFPDYTPLSVVSYSLYENSYDSTLLEGLNGIKDVIAVKGKIKVLTHVSNQN